MEKDTHVKEGTIRPGTPTLSGSKKQVVINSSADERSEGAGGWDDALRGERLGSLAKREACTHYFGMFLYEDTHPKKGLFSLVNSSHMRGMGLILGLCSLRH